MSRHVFALFLLMLVIKKARSSDMEADDKEARQTASAASAPQVFHTLEACYFICLIALLLLFDNKDFEQVCFPRQWLPSDTSLWFRRQSLAQFL